MIGAPVSDNPIRPLTPAENEVAECIGKGWPHRRVAEWLGIHPSTVRVHVANIGAKLHNPDELPTTYRVMLWAAHREWLKRHEKQHNDAA